MHILLLICSWKPFIWRVDECLNLQICLHDFIQKNPKLIVIYWVLSHPQSCKKHIIWFMAGLWFSSHEYATNLSLQRWHLSEWIWTFKIHTWFSKVTIAFIDATAKTMNFIIISSPIHFIWSNLPKLQIEINTKDCQNRWQREDSMCLLTWWLQMNKTFWGFAYFYIIWCH